ncbi:unnamed protein product [Diatraea saccharalis]|uniref:Uncharacterized protein n=1 Tax=Diatraea saccharalis TaxID=40085 RepID=A0A9N9R0M1_9NEOP|nr:unnamed protein product [Diatraea saccharalis]
MGHDPPAGPMCLPKHGGVRDSKFLVTHSVTDPCKSCLTTTISDRGAYPLHYRATRTEADYLEIKCYEYTMRPPRANKDGTKDLINRLILSMHYYSLAFIMIIIGLYFYHDKDQR